MLVVAGSVRSAVEPKQVMFSDGIRPGGDLTELDGVEAARSPVQASGRRTKKVDKSGCSPHLQTWQSRLKRLELTTRWRLLARDGANLLLLVHAKCRWAIINNLAQVIDELISVH